MSLRALLDTVSRGYEGSGSNEGSRSSGTSSLLMRTLLRCKWSKLSSMRERERLDINHFRIMAID